MSNYYVVTSDELAHHGVLGMKWGVRRYQNYDGSLTKKGMEHYRSSESRHAEAKSAYEKAKENYKRNKTESNKAEVKSAKKEVKAAKKQMSKDYDQLKKDKMADKGKDLYQKGKTITGSERTRNVMTAIASGTGILAGILYNSGKTNMAIASIGVGAGLEALTAIKGVSDAIDARYLRAYYGHSR